MRKLFLLVVCLSLLTIPATALAGFLSDIKSSYKQIKNDYKEYHKMGAFDKDGNLQPNNIRVYMESKDGAQEVTGHDKSKIIDGSPLYRGNRSGTWTEYKRIPQSNNMKQVEDMNRLFDKLGITLDEPEDNYVPEWEYPVDEGITVITRRVH